MTKRYKIRSAIFVCAFFATLSVSTVLPSCNKAEEKNDTSTPAFKISEAEKLVVPDAVALPANLPTGNTRVATYFAFGVQKYKAQAVAGSNPVTYQWVFVAPQADLYDNTNKKVGTHSAGPTWQLSAADSVYGQAFNPARTSPGLGATDVDWLLLMPKAGKEPTGFFTNVSYIQRVATKGGKAPTTAPLGANDVVDVPYTAIYRFTKMNQ